MPPWSTWRPVRPCSTDDVDGAQTLMRGGYEWRPLSVTECSARFPLRSGRWLLRRGLPGRRLALDRHQHLFGRPMPYAAAFLGALIWTAAPLATRPSDPPRSRRGDAPSASSACQRASRKAIGRSLSRRIGFSRTEVDWRRDGSKGARLGYLLAGDDYFRQAHRTVDDCQALLEFSLSAYRPQIAGAPP